jgi:hypothetical protein
MVRPDEGAPNGDLFGDASDAESCASACLARSQCVAFDLDTRYSPPSCWLHTSQEDLDSIRSDQGIVLHILRAKCSGIARNLKTVLIASLHHIHFPIANQKEG